MGSGAARTGSGPCSGAIGPTVLRNAGAECPLTERTPPSLQAPPTPEAGP
jgi:hypothetical protein